MRVAGTDKDKKVIDITKKAWQQKVTHKFPIWRDSYSFSPVFSSAYFVHVLYVRVCVILLYLFNLPVHLWWKPTISRPPQYGELPSLPHALLHLHALLKINQLALPFWSRVYFPFYLLSLFFFFFLYHSLCFFLFLLQSCVHQQKISQGCPTNFAPWKIPRNIWVFQLFHVGVHIAHRCWVI